jgi:hypothetical protein
MTHIGDELRFVLARDLKIFDGLGKLARPRLYFLKKSGVLDGDHCLVGEGGHKLNLFAREWLAARLPLANNP